MGACAVVRMRAMVGLDIKNEFYRGTYAGVQPERSTTLGAESAMSTQRGVSGSLTWSCLIPPLYAELGVRPRDAVLISRAFGSIGFPNLRTVRSIQGFRFATRFRRAWRSKRALEASVNRPKPRSDTWLRQSEPRPMRAIQTERGLRLHLHRYHQRGHRGFLQAASRTTSSTPSVPCASLRQRRGRAHLWR